MSLFTVDDACVKCELCARLCVAEIIRISNDGTPYVSASDEKDCMKCGQCVVFCPKSCCYLDFHEERVSMRAPVPDAQAAEALLRSRRSIRSYKEEPVSQEKILRILETTRYSPSAANRQPVRWIVSMTRDKTLKIGKLVAEEFRNRATADPNDEMAAELVMAWDQGRDVVFRGAPQLAVALVDRSHYFPEDAAFALTYFELAAHALGVGCCWAGLFTLAARANDAIGKTFGASACDYIVGAQMFGYPAIGPNHILPPRKKLEVSWV